jgi:hypothetical protein
MPHFFKNSLPTADKCWIEEEEKNICLPPNFLFCYLTQRSQRLAELRPSYSNDVIDKYLYSRIYSLTLYYI